MAQRSRFWKTDEQRCSTEGGPAPRVPPRLQRHRGPRAHSREHWASTCTPAVAQVPAGRGLLRTRPLWPVRSQASDASEVTHLNSDPDKKNEGTARAN